MGTHIGLLLNDLTLPRWGRSQYYTNNGTYAEFVDVTEPHTVVVINYSARCNDIVYYYQDPVNVLPQLTYNVCNYMEKEPNNGPSNS
ncbi:hypothetical protein [Stygiolobus caldivivus]|uniref:Uncharacterized protein n=1 Tax=Stygiolobus caldivivus TaxID=2824673 RepID=A0A8D5U604_9CREN|nr:hypothetical protein [Stygiolobus caldivivus]BCU69897.1 hypothetical protein KN1_11940 [Stygiolobus caldivivus]